LFSDSCFILLALKNGRDDFRKSYKEAHPDSKGVTSVAKEGGEKWKSLTEEVSLLSL